MAHEILYNINTKVALSKDVVFEIKKHDKKLGELLISKGNLEWVPAGGKVNKYRIDWDALGDVMMANGKKVASVKKSNAIKKKRAANKATVKA